MFDLEQSIAEWRNEMLAAGIKTPVPLAELESHLREEAQRQEQLGKGMPQAFELAVQRIGHAEALRREFKKAGNEIETRFVKSIGMACGVVAFFFLLWGVPFLFKQGTGGVPKILGLMAVATAVFIWRYGYRFLPAIRSPWIRAGIGGMCCLGGILWIWIFISQFVPGLLTQAWQTGHLLGWFLVSFLWAWSVVAMLGGVAFGLEWSVRKQISTLN